ncbi:4Fe-4S dicluster domain-containing protein [Thermovirga sp.]|uniref:4Fe-4S double cluster binding domain-containing protein n=1 Tax=Thermovirga sp. TaxID=2699834 RepID=UPI0025F07E40|nr:4Fe-4S dicluster domain-containing protein [Thermovirga sp.]
MIGLPFFEDLKNMLTESGAALVGFADLRDVTPYPELPYGISIGFALDPEIISNITNGPTHEYARLYDHANQSLWRLGILAEEMILSRGGRVKNLPPTIDKVPENLRTILPHKTVATKSGLGWIGKCALLVTKEYGSALRFTSLLTDLELPVGEPITESKCGECKDCLKACPVSAPSGKNWNSTFDRKDFFDVWKCYEKTKIEASRPEIGKLICGMCIAACPYTKDYIKRSGIKQLPLNSH